MNIKDLLIESAVHGTFYRGIHGEFDIQHQNKSHIVFITPDREYARAYADSDSHVYEVQANLQNGFNFGFRTLSTEVQLKDIKTRIKHGIMKSYENKTVSKDQALSAINVLDSIDKEGFNRVWEWYMEVPELSNVLLMAGYDHIVGLEGTGNNTIGYGVLDTSKIKIVSK